MAYVLDAVEHVMTVRTVILQALAGELTWIQAAGILVMPDTSSGRWRSKRPRGLERSSTSRPSPR
jgi:hypothetical protein